MAYTRKHVAASTNNPKTSHTPKEQSFRKIQPVDGVLNKLISNKIQARQHLVICLKIHNFCFYCGFCDFIVFSICFLFRIYCCSTFYFFSFASSCPLKRNVLTKFSTFACLFDNHSFSLCIFIIYQHSLHSLLCDFAWQVEDAEINPRFYIRMPSPLADGYHIGFVTADDKLRARNSSQGLFNIPSLMCYEVY